MFQIKTYAQNIRSYKKTLLVEKAIIAFLEKQGYLKVDVPVLSPVLIPESYLEVFKTTFRYFNSKQDLYLTPSPELFLKRLLAYGVGNCFYLGKAFRNSEPHSPLHSFEFTMLEYYRLNADYMNLADELLDMLRSVNRTVNPKNEKTIVYNKKKISLQRWEKLTVAKAFERYAGISEQDFFDHNALLRVGKEKGYRIEGFSYEDLFSQIYVSEVEPHLGSNGYPTLIYNYPKELAALAKLNPDRKTAQRFEFYIAGIELGDCYTELTDWKEQSQRFETERKKRNEQKKIRHPIDKGFIGALQYGLAQCAGIAVGFERLAMIFANVSSIDEFKLITI